MIKTGLEKLLADPARLAGRRYGILAHGASITGDARPIHRALPTPSALFGPEEPVFTGCAAYRGLVLYANGTLEAT